MKKGQKKNDGLILVVVGIILVVALIGAAWPLLIAAAICLVIWMIFSTHQRKQQEEAEQENQLAEAECAKKQQQKSTPHNIQDAEPIQRADKRPHSARNVAPKPISRDYIVQSKKCFIAVDTETTGLSSEKDRIVEISAVRFCDFMPVDTFTTLINQPFGISEAASKVNHITEEDLKDAPPEGEAMKAFFDFIGEDALTGKIKLVAHNAPFDQHFIEASARRCGMQPAMDFEDTIPICKQQMPGLKNYKLGTVAGELNIEQAQAHRAADDALVCGKIFVVLLAGKEKEYEAKDAAITDMEREICQWVHDTLKDAGCDLEHLTFNVSSYLSVNCWHRVARLKPRAKRPYILVDSSLTLPDTVETAPATKSEGEGMKRVFFEKTDDLAVVSDWLVGEYNRIARDTAKFYLMGGVYEQEIDKMKATQFVIK